jgi:iron complex transport system substrate-binding protein
MQLQRRVGATEGMPDGGSHFAGELRTIQEVASLTGLSPHTLRYYDDIHLLKPCARSDAGYRLYGRGDLIRLREILVWRRLGFPLSEIRALLDSSEPQLADALARQLDVASQQAERFAAIKQQLEHAIDCVDAGRDLADAELFVGLGDVDEVRRDDTGLATFDFLSGSAPRARRRTPRTTSSRRRGGRTVVDMAGRAVEIPELVSRVATNYPALPAMLAMLGGIDRLVAAHEDGTTPLLRRLFPRVARVPVVFNGGSFVDVATLVASKPDVVFSTDLQAPDLLPLLERLDIPVVTFKAFSGPDQVAEAARLMAEILDTPLARRRAEHYLLYTHDTQAIGARAEAIPAAERPKVYYAAGSLLATEGKDSSVTVWINHAGGTNVAAAIAPTGSFSFPTVRCDRRFRSISAVRNDRILVPPRGVFGWAVRSPESALMPYWAARHFQPRLFADMNLEAMTAGFYRCFYGAALSERQVSRILAPR